MPASRLSPALARGVLIAATFVTFARALGYPLQRGWDDGRFILDNPDVQHVSAQALWRMFSRVQFEAYHPLHLLSYWLDVPWFGPNPWLIHAVSLALWICAALLVFACAQSLVNDTSAALIATLLCVLHPVQVEAVSWASGRKDALALLLAAASLLWQLRAHSAWDRAAWLARLCYALALLSKTSAITLPLFALSLDLFARRIPWRQAWLRQLPSLLLAAAVAASVIHIWSEHTMLRSNLGGPELAPLRASQTLGHQLLTAVWPARTAPMYATASIAKLDWARSTALVAYVFACIWAYRSRRRLVFAGLLGFVLLLLPVSNLVPLYFPLQDRYLSLPLLALACAVVGLFESPAARSSTTPWRRSQGLQRLLALATIALALRTWQYEGVWQSEPRLWGHAVRTQPDAEYAWLKLGEVQRATGQLEAAILAYRGAVMIAPLRKLAHAALFEAVALRDERWAARTPSLARSLAERYHSELDQPLGLRDFANSLYARGYTRSAELPLQAALAFDPLPEQALEHAAIAALRAQRRSLARFYLHNLPQAPEAPPLRAVWDEPYFRVVP
jgi:protein O-mannosyl-transferase